MEHRRRGVQFRRGEDGEHTLSVNVRTINAVLAFVLQLATLVGLLWGIAEWRIAPMIDERIEAQLDPYTKQIRANTDWITAHRAELIVGLGQMEQFRKETEKDRDDLLVEIRYIRARVDELYARQMRAGR